MKRTYPVKPADLKTGDSEDFEAAVSQMLASYSGRDALNDADMAEIGRIALHCFADGNQTNFWRGVYLQLVDLVNDYAEQQAPKLARDSAIEAVIDSRRKEVA